MENANRRAWFDWVRELAFVVAIAGGAWAIATAIGDLRADLSIKIERNAALIERNAEAIERNAKAIERNAEAIEHVEDTLGEAIGELEESVALLAGQFAEHVREHQPLASR